VSQDKSFARKVVNSKPLSFGTLAQLVEHRIEDAGVTGSNPVGTTLFTSDRQGAAQVPKTSWVGFDSLQACQSSSIEDKQWYGKNRCFIVYTLHIINHYQVVVFIGDMIMK